MMGRGFTYGAVLAWTAFAMAGAPVPAQAQDLRDPTTPPPAVSAAPGASAPSPLGIEGGMSVIVRDGKAGLVVGTRVVQPGQKVGRWTLERITETEVWLRDGPSLRKVSRFNGIQRHDPDLKPVCSLSAAATAPSKLRGTQSAKSASLSQAYPTSTKADPQCDAPPTRSSNP